MIKLLWTALATVLLIVSALGAWLLNDMATRHAYEPGVVTIHAVEAQRDGSVVVRFTAPLDTMARADGADLTRAGDRVAVTFMRAPANDASKAHAPLVRCDRGRRMDQCIRIPEASGMRIEFTNADRANPNT